MSGYPDRGRNEYGPGRDDRGRDNYDNRRSGDAGGRYGDRVNRDSDRRRSRSPGRDQQGETNTRGRGNFRNDFRGGRGGHRMVDESTSNTSKSTLPPVPASVPIPSGTGAKIPYNEHTTRGNLGRPATVSTNHFVIQSMPIIKIYQYELRFRVPESSQARGSDKITANQTARVLVSSTLVGFLDTDFVFDGVSLGWSPKEIVPVDKSRSTTISLGDRRDGKPNEVDVLIRNTGPLDIRRIIDYIKDGVIGLNPTGDQNLETFKYLFALFRHEPAKTMASRPNSNAFFQRSAENSMPLASTGGVLEALRGIFQSVQVRFSRISICLDVTTTPFWTPGLSLIECICALTGQNVTRNLQERFLQSAGSFFQACGILLGCYFNVRHLSADRNTKKLKFLKWSDGDAISTVFEERLDDDAARPTSVAEYFLRKYNIKLMFPNLPLAHTRDGDIPLELGFIASGERFKGVLQGAHTADFIKFATTPAFVRRQHIDANLRILSWHLNSTIRAHGLSVDPKMLKVRARILEPPQIEYGSGTISPREASWNLRGIRFVQPAIINSWVLVSFGPQVDRLPGLGRDIIQSFRSVGMTVPNQPPSILVGNPQGDIGNILDNAVRKGEQDFKCAPDLILVIVKASSAPLYGAVKNCLDIVQGIASQVMSAEKVFKDRGILQYLGNISMKVNVKLGGTNCTVHQPIFKKSRWMLIGGDISSAGPSALKCDPPPPSTAAMCATIDASCTSYIGNATMQQSIDSNVIINARAMFKDLLYRFKEKNDGRMPERIVYYRDGVSESEFEGIKRHEGLELHRLCEATNTKITIIVVIKRHHTRFFPEPGNLATKLGNVPPGTVVENHSSRNDAYIVAHRDLIGTKRPTRYVSIVDENNLSADDFQTLTYWISYSYARATTAVAVVPPIYYADQICERARTIHLQDTPDGNQTLPQVHQNLKWRMYWQ